MPLTADNCEVAYVNVAAWTTTKYVDNVQLHHLAAKLGSKIYSYFVEPSMPTEKAISTKGDRSKSEPSAPLETVLEEFFKFLKSSPKPVLLVSHDYGFSRTALLKYFFEARMMDMFDDVIAGFSSTSLVFKKKFPHRRDSELTFPALAREFLSKTYTEESLDPLCALSDLEELVTALHIPKSAFIDNGHSFESAIWEIVKKTCPSVDMENLVFLKYTIRWEILIIMAKAGLRCSSLEQVFQKTGSQGLRKYLYGKLGNIWPGRDNLHETVEEILRYFENQSVIDQNLVDSGLMERNVDNSFPFDKQQEENLNDIDSLIREQGSSSQVPVDNIHPYDRQQKENLNKIVLFLMEEEPFNQITVDEDD